jgi:hypothetical protein
MDPLDRPRHGRAQGGQGVGGQGHSPRQQDVGSAAASGRDDRDAGRRRIGQLQGYRPRLSVVLAAFLALIGGRGGAAFDEMSRAIAEAGGGDQGDGPDDDVATIDHG